MYDKKAQWNLNKEVLLWYQLIHINGFQLTGFAIIFLNSKQAMKLLENKDSATSVTGIWLKLGDYLARPYLTIKITR